VVEHLAPIGGTTVVSVTNEDEYFPPPPELRELLRGLSGALAVLSAAPAGAATDPLREDRGLPAAGLLSLGALGSSAA
jgi:4-hydroxy-3-methylbut-2-enyl diphosphate reductase